MEASALLTRWPETFLGRWVLGFTMCWVGCMLGALVYWLLAREVEWAYVAIAAFIMSSTFGVAKAATVKPNTPIKWWTRRRGPGD